MSHVTKSFSRDVKLQAVTRMEAGESSSSLAAELGVKRNRKIPITKDLGVE